MIDSYYDMRVRFVAGSEEPDGKEVIAQYERDHPDRKVRSYCWELAEEAGHHALAELFEWGEVRPPRTTDDGESEFDFVDVVERP